MELPRNHRPHHPHRALRRQEMGTDIPETHSQERTTGQIKILQYHRPPNRQEHMDGIDIVETPLNCKGLQLFMERHSQGLLFLKQNRQLHLA